MRVEHERTTCRLRFDGFLDEGHELRLEHRSGPSRRHSAHVDTGDRCARWQAIPDQDVSERIQRTEDEGEHKYEQGGKPQVMGLRQVVDVDLAARP